MVLDSEALAQISSGRLSRPLLIALEAAAATAGQVLMPTCVLLECGHGPAETRAAGANRLLRTVVDDELTRSRAVRPFSCGNQRRHLSLMLIPQPLLSRWCAATAARQPSPPQTSMT
ncbi:MAG TPA: hypothetical protein VFO16_20295 [Pseudonocardiaceae bacterium]|nr:hypothetical protein [Pseudonocardiaceae bacterium]